MAGADSLTFIDGGYRTPPGRPAVFARHLPGVRFYTRIAAVVWRAAASARRGTYDDAAWSGSSLEILRAIEEVGALVDVEGVEHFRKLAGPCVFIGNHMSTLETFLLPSIVRPAKRVTFIVKKPLVEYPVFGHVMRSRDPIVVGRTNPREDLTAVFEGGATRLAAGISIVVFPQTTRTATFDPAAFNSIGIKLAKRAEVPIVPVALKTDAWGTGGCLKDFGRIDPAKTVHIAFGEPLRVRGSGAAEHRQVVEFIRKNLLSWGGTVAQAAGPAED